MIQDQKVFSCYEYGKFWVSWKDGLISSGRGDVVGKKLLVKYRDLFVREIIRVKVASRWSEAGGWWF